MTTWVRRSLNVGVLTAGALLAGGAAAQAGPVMDSTGNIGALTGNQLNLPVQAPIDVCGNAVAVIGAATAGCEGGAAALSPEWRFGGTAMDSSGNIGLLVGNQLNVPVQVPVDVCGNAVAVAGTATAGCEGGAKAGPDRHKRDHHKRDHHKKNHTYEQAHALDPAPASSPHGGQWHQAPEYGRSAGGPEMDSTGNVGLLAGNQVNAPVQIPVSVCGNSVALLGTATAGCEGGAVAR